ncbi:hypothetical protein TNCT_346201 [Trichonephila clavata]|uniref:Uncharacterized protein n=1 Tax=Trichonephila clavata TaxID=2740835 RepID=A0A8X6GU59_TRICU|nr:hypothetical protein TNCT_346201 [Trichonephila clavata]
MLVNRCISDITTVIVFSRFGSLLNCFHECALGSVLSTIGGEASISAEQRSLRNRQLMVERKSLYCGTHHIRGSLWKLGLMSVRVGKEASEAAQTTRPQRKQEPARRTSISWWRV